ncbi:ROK family transcriptional regulator [Ideonella sp.]|uniref:ROK family transcriptional regulator n=1 Tax=Ideonella sp. TaxID=1929293 RepID=UPI003BB6D22B
MLGDLTEAAGHQQLLKGINRMSLVRHLCVNPGLSRADLSEQVGLTKSTVSMLVRELLLEGWLVEREVVATGELGRRPTPLFIDPSRMLLLGVEIGIETCRIVATSLTGEVLASQLVDQTGPTPQAEACIAALATALQSVAGQFDAVRQQVIGIGIGLPGGVDEATGLLRFAPNLGWRNLPFGALLGQRLRGSTLDGVPLFLQNEADVAAVGEMEFGTSTSASATDPLLYLSLNQGVGAGVIVGDRLLTGHRGFAGEVGHMVLQIDGPLCSCGRLGCAEALIGLRALAGSTNPRPLQTLQLGLAQRDPATVAKVGQAGRYLGVLLQNLTAAYDPGAIVLGGAGIELGEDLLQPALQTLHQYAEAAGLPPPEVRTSRYGADAVAVGAAALARYRLTRPLISPAYAGKAGTPAPLTPSARVAVQP